MLAVLSLIIASIVLGGMIGFDLGVVHGKYLEVMKNYDIDSKGRVKSKVFTNIKEEIEDFKERAVIIRPSELRKSKLLDPTKDIKLDDLYEDN